MHDAVDDCSVALQQGTSTLSTNNKGQTERGKMDQPQTHFEESAVFAVIGSIRHQDPLGYANNHSQKQNGQIRELLWNKSTAVYSRFWSVTFKKNFSVKSKSQGHQSMSVFLIFRKIIKTAKQQKNYFFFTFNIQGKETW